MTEAYTLHVDPSLSVDIAVPASILPDDVVPGSLVAIRPVLPITTSKGKQVDRPLLFRVGSNDEGDKRRGKNVIVNGHVSQAIKWVKNRVQVQLSVVDVDNEDDWHATYLDFHFQNIYLGRPDMLRTALALNDTPLFTGQRVPLPGSAARLRVGAMRSSKKAVSAVLTSDTRVTWRSESGRVFLFVEVSAEMWQFEEDGSMLKEKCDEFLKKLSEHLDGTSHVLTIVLYGRVFYDTESEGFERWAPMNKDPEGRWYRDFFKVVADLKSDPSEIASLVSKQMQLWQSEVLVRTTEDGKQKLAGRIAYAHESPILEAANLALNSFEEHWVDRDLQRTGLQLLVITAGTSYYNVPKKLARMTTERMLYHGIGLDLISLSKTPLHAVPLFAFRSQEPGLSETSMPSDQQDPLYYDPVNDDQEQNVYYTSPLFVFTSFFGFQPDKPHRIDRFMPRARCYSLSSQGVGERIHIAIPPSKPIGQLEREQYDLEAIGAIRNRTTWKDSGASNEMSGASGGYGADSSSHQAADRASHEESEDFEDRGRSKVPVAVKKSVRNQSQASRSRTPVPRALQQQKSRDVSPASKTGSLTARTLSPATRGARSPSVSSALTHNSNNSKDVAPRKPSTPALIARLAPQASTGQKSSRGWLGLFKGPQTAKRDAPSVSIQKVSASALPISKMTTTTTKGEVTTAISLDGGSSSLRTSSDMFTNSIQKSPVSPTPISDHAGGPTMPISITARASQAKKSEDANPQRGSYKPEGELKISANTKPFGVFNPSKPMRRNRGLIEQQRRWANVFPRHESDQRSVNWISITRGACLPLATDYLPTVEALKNHYTDYRYSIPLTSTDSSFLLRHESHRSHAFELILEMACQRVAQGFQICTPANAVGGLDELNPATDKTVTDVLQDMDQGESSALYFSLSRTIQRISYDRRTHCVLVKVMRKKRSWKKTPVGHSALVWSQGAESWSQKSFDFPYPLMTEPEEWEHIDRVVAGIEQADQRRFLRYWRTRLVLLPGDTVPDREFLLAKIPALALEGEVTDEDIQLQGFFTLMETIQTLRWTPPGTDKVPTPTELTNLSPPAWAAKTARAQAAQAMQPSPTSATALQNGGSQVRASRWLRRVTSPPTRDESVGATSDKSAANAGLSATLEAAEADDGVSPARLESLLKRQKVQMSWQVILDLDPQQKSDRAERVMCHFDRSHNVNAAYHIELAWLSGSGRVIHSTIQQWMRQMSRFGLNLVEATTRTVESDHNPFIRAHLIKFAVPPPQLVAGLESKLYETRLLEHFDFILDVGADSTFSADIDVEYTYRKASCENSQFIHRSGTLLASIAADGLYAAPNRIYTTHSGTSADEHLARIKAVCGDAIELQKLWDEFAAHHTRSETPNSEE